MTDTRTAQVGANVRAEMARRRLPQQSVALALGLSQTGMSKRLNGIVPWDVNELAAAAEVLGVPVSVLLEEHT